MPYLVSVLGNDSEAGFTLESGQTVATHTGTRRV
jgi:23S rRNA (adenine2030-N6)-methyltransferase